MMKRALDARLGRGRNDRGSAGSDYPERNHAGQCKAKRRPSSGHLVLNPKERIGGAAAQTADSAQRSSRQSARTAGALGNKLPLAMVEAQTNRQRVSLGLVL